MKKLTLIIILILALLLTACTANSPVTPVETKGTMPTQEATPEVSVNSRGEVTVEPSPENIVVQSESPISSEVSVNVPEVDGCTSEVVDGKVLYYAEKGNNYGLEVGELFGEFIQNVNLMTDGENNVEGGWALSAKTVHVLLQQASTETGEDVTKTKIILPLDISGLNKDDELDISIVSPFYGEEVYDDYHTFLLEFGDSTLTFVNSFDTGDQDALLGYKIDKLEINYVKETGEKGTENVYTYVFDLKGPNPISCHSEYFLPENIQGSFFFGDAIVDIKSPLIINYRSTWSADIDDIFTFQGLPVFLMANK